MNMSNAQRYRPVRILAATTFAGVMLAFGYSLWNHVDRLLIGKKSSEGITEPGLCSDTKKTTSRSSGTPGPIVDWHLFGRPPEKEATAAPRPADAPTTRQDLKLKGVLSTDDTDAARAIILVPGLPERTYRIGETLPGGAEVTAIGPGDALLKQKGGFERLPLDKLPATRGARLHENGTGSEPSKTRRKPPKPVQPVSQHQHLK